MAYDLTVDDFSDGIQEYISSAEQPAAGWSRIYGFVLGSGTSIESQPSCQQLVPVNTSFTGVEWVRPLRNKDGEFLVVRRDDGSIWYTRIPSDNLSRDDLAGTNGSPSPVNWTRIVAPSNPKVEFAGYASYGDTLSLYDNAMVLFRPGVNPQPMEWIVAQNGTLVVKTYPGVYPTAQADPNQAFGTTNVFPAGKVVCMWYDYACVANTYYALNADQPITAQNRTDYPNGLWISQPGAATVAQFHPVDSFQTVGDPAARIVAMQVVNAGLLVVTEPTIEGGQSGMLLLRGTPHNYQVEVIRQGLGSYKMNELKLWPETGTAAFITSNGKIVHSGGSSETTADLATYGLKEPDVGGPFDNCQGHGPYMFLHRKGRLFTMRVFSDSGSWTELITPYPGETIISMASAGNSLYFVQRGEVWRYNFVYNDERGQINGVAVPLELGTATFISKDDTKSQATWFRVNIRANSEFGTGVIQSVESIGGPVYRQPIIDSAGRPVFNNTQLRLLTELNIPMGTEEAVRVFAHGTSLSASALIKFRGNVSVESVGFEVAGKRLYNRNSNQNSQGGADGQS